jgi:general nucleoside transport system ATP-binding protein
VTDDHRFPPQDSGGGTVDKLALRLSGVSKRFGDVTANDRVDFTLFWGEIHALLGENGAGKTTLMRIVTGLYQPDEGDLQLDGETVQFHKPEHALRAGIGMVHQHFTLVPTLTELQNLVMRPSLFPWGNASEELRRRSELIADTTGLRITPDRLVADASIGERQRLEIVKLLCRGARILIFDEPSAALSPDEWSELAILMRQLAADGHAIVLISHKLPEVFATADRYTVMRAGAVVGSGPVSQTTPDELVTMMVGESVPERPAGTPADPGRPVLTIRGLNVARDPENPKGPQVLSEVDLELRAGEILGVAGVAGSGQNELVEVVMGIRQAVSGQIELIGEPFENRTPSRFYAAGGALIAEDRHGIGIVSGMALWENITMRALRRAPLSRRGIVNTRAARARARELMTAFDVRAGSEKLAIGRLSGGNQQKAVLAREFADQPTLLIAVQPVRGLDVRATDFVYRQLSEHRERGGATLLISLDLDEVITMSDRIAVLAHGQIRGVLAADEATKTRIGALMTSQESLS